MKTTTTTSTSTETTVKTLELKVGRRKSKSIVSVAETFIGDVFCCVYGRDCPKTFWGAVIGFKGDCTVVIQPLEETVVNNCVVRYKTSLPSFKPVGKPFTSPLYQHRRGLGVKCRDEYDVCAMAYEWDFESPLYCPVIKG